MLESVSWRAISWYEIESDMLYRCTVLVDALDKGEAVQTDEDTDQQDPWIVSIWKKRTQLVSHPMMASRRE
jgi:hypothetical protein